MSLKMSASFPVKCHLPLVTTHIEFKFNVLPVPPQITPHWDFGAHIQQQNQDNELFLKPKKYKFYKTKVEYLGMIIEEGKISMDSGKLKGIQDWPTPTMVKQTRGFLGFGNFYQRFIQGFSNLARPLNDLLKKDKKFEWTDDCQKAFDELKK